MIDTVFVVTRDTIVAEYPAYESPWWGWNVVTLILIVIGWLFVDWRRRDAQKIRLYDELRIQSWVRANSAIDSYIEWLRQYELAIAYPAGSVDEITKQLHEIRRREIGRRWFAEVRALNKLFPGIMSEAFSLHDRERAVTKSVRLASLQLRIPPHDRTLFENVLGEGVIEIGRLAIDVEMFRLRWQEQVIQTVQPAESPWKRLMSRFRKRGN